MFIQVSSFVWWFKVNQWSKPKKEQSITIPKWKKIPKLSQMSSLLSHILTNLILYYLLFLHIGHLQKVTESVIYWWESNHSLLPINLAHALSSSYYICMNFLWIDISRDCQRDRAYEKFEMSLQLISCTNHDLTAFNGYFPQDLSLPILCLAISSTPKALSPLCEKSPTFNTSNNSLHIESHIFSVCFIFAPLTQYF